VKPQHGAHCTGARWGHATIRASGEGTLTVHRAGTGTLVLVTAGLFGIVTSITMIGPLLVDLSREFGISVGRAGLLAAASAAPQALGSPFAGVISDRLGRRPMIVFALGSIGLLALAAAAAPTFGALVAARFFTGLLGSFGPTSLMAAVGDLFPAERRSRAMGWFNSGFGLAAIAGVPALGAIGGWLGWRSAFVANGVVLLVLALAIQLWFPSAPAVAPGAGMLATYRAVAGAPRLPSALGANVLERSMFGVLAFYLPAFLMLRFSMNAAEVAPFLAAVAAGMIAGNVFGGWLGDRISRPGTFIAAQLTAAALGLVLFGLALPLPAAVAVGTLVTFVNASSRPGFLAFTSEVAPANRGAVFGLLALSNQGGMVLGATLGAFVLELGGAVGLAAVVAVQGAGASLLAVPLVRPRRPVA
jgi:DHA1 family inner membrane transport protein